MKTRSLIILLFFAWNGNYSCIAQDLQDTKKLIASYIYSMRHSVRTGNHTGNFSKDLLPILDSIYGNDQILNNGKIYTGYYGISGSPFLYDNAKDGQITIDNLSFVWVKLQYDIYKDQIICAAKNRRGNNNPIIMNSLTVNNFNFKDKYFINYPYETMGLEGYYELIYQGKEFSLIAKWKKYKIRGTTKNQLDNFSESSRVLFLVNNKTARHVKNKKVFINFFGLDKSTAKTKYKHKFPKLSTASNDELSILSESFDNNK